MSVPMSMPASSNAPGRSAPQPGAFMIGERAIGTGMPPYIIAEIGVNHDGNMARGHELIRAAKDAGADAVKFQLFEADRLMSEDSVLAKYQAASGATDPRELLRELELSAALLDTLCRAARETGLHAIVTVFSDSLVQAAESMDVSAYKTASPDIIHRPLLEALARTGRPLIVSTGAASMDEVMRAAAWVRGSPVAYLQCVSAYPTNEEDAALAGIADLAGATRAVVGYSDHTTAIDSGALAVMAGACILEKHLTYDRGAIGPDHASSLDPAQFGQYVGKARRAFRMLGDSKRVLPVERDVRAVSRQSLVTTRALKTGDVLRPDDLTCKRPGTGIPPYRLAEMIGRRLLHDVNENRVLRDEDFA
ncbi:MAG: N-acetylneuraminate synthase family protein [Phycisphaerae bacterium]|nr:N-acetylneuraminate synthase family protein [Phycisphaerae bacterium]